MHTLLSSVKKQDAIHLDTYGSLVGKACLERWLGSFPEVGISQGIKFQPALGLHKINNPFPSKVSFGTTYILIVQKYILIQFDILKMSSCHHQFLWQPPYWYLTNGTPSNTTFQYWKLIQIFQDKQACVFYLGNKNLNICLEIWGW